jgi:hypothetical protein
LLLRNSLIICHAGMASNVGPILEQVTEKYLLRLDKEARAEGRRFYDSVLSLLQEKNLDLSLPANANAMVSQLGQTLTSIFLEPIQSIIPQAHNAYTAALLQRAQTIPGFRGFCMHGG